MDGLVVIGILLLGGFVISVMNKKEDVAGMQDKFVTIDNIRRGVQEGWYKAILLRVNGQPAVYLYGIDTAGKQTGDTYPISESDWQTLKNEGYDVAE